MTTGASQVERPHRLIGRAIDNRSHSGFGCSSGRAARGRGVGVISRRHMAGPEDVRERYPWLPPGSPLIYGDVRR
jgi:hypothetical protein